MIVKTQAVVLRITPFTNTSAIVDWFTRDHGRIACLIKGAYRPKSFYLGQFDWFYTCELLYYTRMDGEGLHFTHGVWPMKVRTPFRRDWRAMSAASYLCDIIARVHPSAAPDPRSFQLLDDTLDNLTTAGANRPLIHWFELKLLELLGLAPYFDSCLNCRGALTSRQVHFSESRGGLLCPACASHDHTAAQMLPPDILAMLRAWLRSNHASAALRTRGTDKQIQAIKQFLGQFLSYHLETALDSRRIALRLIEA